MKICTRLKETLQLIFLSEKAALSDYPKDLMSGVSVDLEDLRYRRVRLPVQGNYSICGIPFEVHEDWGSSYHWTTYYRTVEEARLLVLQWKFKMFPQLKTIEVESEWAIDPERMYYDGYKNVTFFNYKDAELYFKMGFIRNWIKRYFYFRMLRKLEEQFPEKFI